MFKGKNVFITGASGDIGLAVARAFIRNGASVLLHYNENPGKLDSLDDLSSGRDISLHRIRIDFTSRESINQAMLNPIFNDIDIVVHAAGVISDGSVFRMSDFSWDSVINIDLSAPFIVTRKLLKTIVERKGNIIFISSVSGVSGNAGQVNYSAAKAGIIGMTKSFAKELARYGVRVNCIAPGFIKSGMTDSLGADKITEIEKTIPMSRMGKPDEVADAVLFMASDRASYITGTVLNVNGGFYI